MSQDSGAPPPGSWRAMVMEALNRAEAGEEPEDDAPARAEARGRAPAGDDRAAEMRERPPRRERGTDDDRPADRPRRRRRPDEGPADHAPPHAERSRRPEPRGDDIEDLDASAVEPARPRRRAPADPPPRAAEPEEIPQLAEARLEDRPRRQRRRPAPMPGESGHAAERADEPVVGIDRGGRIADAEPAAAERHPPDRGAMEEEAARREATLRAAADREAAERDAATRESAAAADAAAMPAARETGAGRAGAEPPDRETTAAKPQAAPQAQRVDPLLASLLRFTQHFARPVSEADIRLAVPIGVDGMSLQEFRRAAQRMGYKTGDAEIDHETAGDLPPPFLAHDRASGRCVSVLSRDGDAVVTFDPLSGEVSLLGPEELADAFDAAILIKPENEFEAREHDWRSMLWSRMRGVVMELLLASFVINLFALAAPLFIMTVYNKIVGQKALDTLTILALGMGTVYAFDLLLRILRGYISTHTGARMEALIGAEVMHHLLRLPYKHFESTPTGMIAERLRQMDTIRAFFTGQMPMTLVDLLFVFVFLTVLFFMSPVIGFIVLGAMPIFVILSASFHATQKKLTEENFLGQAAKTSALSEVVHNALTVKSLALEADVERRWEQRLGLSAWTGYRAGNLANAIAVASQVLQQAIGLLIIVFGARQIIAEEMSIGALIAANILATRALAPMRQVVSAWHQVQEVRAAFSRINDIMSEPTEAGPGELGAGMALKGDIAFEEVTFRYAEDIPPVIEEVSFEVNTGEMLGIIGPSGSGKSTLAKLLQGLYEPDSGRVLIDGTDIQHISPAALRRQIGVVPQEVQLFAGTVRENISMGVADKDPARIVAVSKFVGAHDFIQHLPKGYDTNLTERGGGLSAGQRQLLSIARALIRNPRILVLDEATSALDPVTEERFMKNLRRASRGRTIIVISHRMGPVSIADKVGLVIGGQLERIGPPREIIAFARTRMAENAREAQQA